MGKIVILGFGLLFYSAALRAGPVYEVLPKDRIPKQKLKPCALIHVWATWCTPCIEELPRFLAFVTKHRKITPVIIDVSSGYIQEQFSKKWLKQLAPPFVTYLKPDKEAESDYLSAIESPWPGKVPYNALYDRGKKKGRWLGTLDFAKDGPAIARLCR